MNVFKPRVWKQISAVGSRFYKARDMEVNKNPIPTELEIAFEKMKWARDYNEQETTFSKLFKAFSRRKDDQPRRLLLADDFTFENMQMWLKEMKKYNMIETQRYREDRHETLGNDLAVAHFIVYRGGRVKFYGHNHWIKTVKNEDYYENLPKSFDPTMFLEAVDAQGMQLIYEAFENFKGLARLRWLSLNDNPHFNDWCLDRISCELKDSLEYLDISNCRKVTYRGLTCLYRMEKLKVLKVENIADSLEFQLSCLELEEAIPELKIEGVNYMEPDQSKREVQ
ncbi:distal membrane-arm assembly complex protein 2-like [Nilaparvata lugens]|uniref:distal membrane-arm assembly complex protein 2-like n=1 Tax=Nilaparvata lugens TaxID=108931 RepID=UPI00193E1ECD|nr:distal membrane-arm assembly complex protein 2-like [Nilaparvata lugens]